MPRKKQESTVTIKRYKAGVIEGWFIQKAIDATERKSKLALPLTVIANTIGATKQFFRSLTGRIRKIGFTTTHLKCWAGGRLVDLSFFVQGTIGLLTLGLFTPGLTAKSSRLHARLVKDLQTLRAKKQIDEEIASGKDVYADLETPTEGGEKRKSESAVPVFQRERVRRNTMSDDELDAELDAKLGGR